MLLILLCSNRLTNKRENSNVECMYFCYTKTFVFFLFNRLFKLIVYEYAYM